jgi:ABC-type dipeptide/oligopeptide/nickel transport system permease component
MVSILSFTVKRVLVGIVVLWAIVTIVFILEHAPGTPDPIKLILGSHYTYGNYTRLVHEYGLDIPGWQQYLNFLGLAPILSWFGIHFGHGGVVSGLLEGDFGYSYEFPGTPVWDQLHDKIPVSLKLGFYALALSLLVCIPVGIISALSQNSILDHTLQGTSMFVYAIPPFVLAPIMQNFFGINLHWFPVQGWGDSPKELVMPVIVYAAGLMGYFAKSMRSFLLEVMQQDYIRTARAKGLQERTVIWLHAMKNTLVALASIVGPTIGYLIAGAFIVEYFFEIPGIGYLTITSVLSNDYGVIEGVTIALAGFVVLVNMLTDIFYSVVNPQIRL